jgi:hypothetical protein
MINFYCPLGKGPNGGHKVIYNTVEELNLLGINARVLHPIPKYKIKWFNTKAEVNIQKKIKSSDYFIVPEVCLSFFDEHKILNHSKYSILVQNGYFFLGSENPRNSIKTFYENSDFIFCVSQDSAEVIKMLDPNLSKKIILFEPSMTRFCSEGVDSPKMKTISYMPRKNSLYSDIVINLLRSNLPKNWEIIEIDGQPENKVIELLKKSSIFLNFSGLEGNPAPPLEAAVLGNIVIGNHGNGAKNYWHEPLFIKVNQDDLKGYVTKTLELVKKIDLKQDMEVNYENSRLDLISSLKKRITLSSVISNLVTSKELAISQLKGEGEYFYSLTLFKYLAWRIKVKLNSKIKKALSK